jgi:hypothetical protein
MLLSLSEIARNNSSNLRLLILSSLIAALPAQAYTATNVEQGKSYPLICEELPVLGLSPPPLPSRSVRRCDSLNLYYFHYFS